MSLPGSRSSVGRAVRMLGLLLLGTGLSACRSEPGGNGDAGTEVDAGTPFPTVARGANLLEVDARQTFLLSVRADGTYAQSLPEGEAVRVADRAEAARAANDGSAAVLWSADMEGLRSVWLWRPGMSAAIPLTLQSRGAIIHDAALSYVAFLEEASAGVTSLSVVRTATCMPGSCEPTRPIQVEGGTPELRGGGSTLLLADGTKTWLVDAATGGVTDLGTLPGRPFLSPMGTRYGWAAEGRVVLFDTATGTSLWDHGWRDDVNRPGWLPLSTPLILDEVNVLVNTEGRWLGAPAEVPPGHALHACADAGCREAVSNNTCWTVRLGEQRALYCREDLCPFVRCPPLVNTFRDSAARTLYILGEAGTLLGPVYTEGFTEAARVKQGTDGALGLEWERQDAATAKLTLQGEPPLSPFLFVPGPRRVLYLQPVSLPEGRREQHLWTWDGQQVVDLGVLDGVPAAPGAVLVRDNPPALYLDVRSITAGGANHIVRVVL